MSNYLHSRFTGLRKNTEKGFFFFYWLSGGNKCQYFVPDNSHTLLYFCIDGKVLGAAGLQTHHCRIQNLGHIGRWKLPFSTFLQSFSLALKEFELKIMTTISLKTYIIYIYIHIK